MMIVIVMLGDLELSRGQHPFNVQVGLVVLGKRRRLYPARTLLDYFMGAAPSLEWVVARSRVQRDYVD